MKKQNILWFGLIIVFLGCISKPDSDGENLVVTSNEVLTDSVKSGEKIFFKNCVVCHHKKAEDNMNIFGTALDVKRIKATLQDTVNHNGLSFVTETDIKLLIKYLN